MPELKHFRARGVKLAGDGSRPRCFDGNTVVWNAKEVGQTLSKLEP